MSDKARLYFYKEHDVVKKYTYCSLCGTGPFTENDKLRGEITYLAGGKGSEIHYCKQCMFNQGLKVDIKDDKAIEQRLPKIISDEDVSIKSLVKLEIKQQASPPQKGSVFVYMMQGSDGVLFCSYDYNIKQHIDDVNNGVVKHTGTRSTSYPFTLAYKRAVNSEDEATSFVKIIRTLSKAFKEALIKNYDRSMKMNNQMN